MAVKYLDLPDVGKVGLYKRRGIRAIKLSVTATGDVRVSLPNWMPYKAAIAFVSSHKQWIADHKRPTALIKTGTRIGKYHYFRVERSDKYGEIQVKIVKEEVYICCPLDLSDTELTLNHIKIQKTANKVLKIESEMVFPDRINDLASRFGFNYNQLKIRHLKSRWGSCNQNKEITLNYFLIQLPWELIDYVLIHELAHTKELSHGQAFWDEVIGIIPDYREKRRKLKKYQPSVLLQA